MAITKRGTAWELLQSAWVLGPPGSMGILSWAAFLYAGIRTRHRPWMLAAGVYFVALVAALVLQGRIDRWGAELLIGLWVASTVHALVARAEFLIRLDARRSAAGSGTPASRGAPARPVDPSVYAPFAPVAPQPPTTPPAPPADGPPAAAPVDLNAAPEAAIAALPGIGPILARRAVELREARGGFASVDDFGNALELKPHILERIRPLAFATPRDAPPRPTGGRRVDY